MQAMWGINERDSMDLGTAHLGMEHFLTEWKTLNSVVLCFPGSSAGKESACDAGDPGSIPGLQRSTREGIGYPLQHPWAFLVAQLVKNLPAMRETWVQSLGWNDPPEKWKVTHSSILAWRITWTVQSMGSQRVRHNGVTFTYSKKYDICIWYDAYHGVHDMMHMIYAPQCLEKHYI